MPLTADILNTPSSSPFCALNTTKTPPHGAPIKEFMLVTVDPVTWPFFSIIPFDIILKSELAPPDEAIEIGNAGLIGDTGLCASAG